MERRGKRPDVFVVLSVVTRVVMAELYQLFELKNAALAEFSAQLSIAEEEYPKENIAIVHLQRVFRGSVARDRIHQKSLTAREIQRVFRGHAGRQRVRQIISLKNEARLLQIYHYYALQVQKSFRGYYSRKYKQDHSSRKKYLKSVEEVGEKIRESMRKYAESQAEREEYDSRKQKEESFQQLTQNLHHLLSTKQIRGVYNPDPAYVEIPTVDDVPIEEYLRGAIKDLLRTKGMSKTKLIRDLNGTLKIPYKGLKNRLSLQASAPYDCIKNAKRSEMILHKLLSMEPTSTFRVGGKTKILEQKVVPLSVGDAYMDRWSNPLLMRGVPKSQLQLTERAKSRTTLPTFAPAPEQPFYITASGNKSATLPNGLFDVIADALESGGVTQRHLGQSARFGLSTNCDNRTAQSSLPLPPPKASTLKAATLGKTTKTTLKIPVKTAVPPVVKGSPSEESAIVDPLASSDEEDEGEFLFAS